jgi:hypothetical protein
MLKLNPILLSVTALLIAALACTLPGVATPEPNLLGTTVAETIAARQTQNAQPGIPITGQGTPTPITFPTLYLESPTVSPTASLSPTPAFTATPTIPLITVSVATNCRVGPGKAYERVGALLVDEPAEVYGRDPSGNYWYIRNPDDANDFCWLWGEYATLTGNYLALPLLTPPPTPTLSPAFNATYNGRDTCNGWWIDVAVENTGGMTFRSIAMTVKDTVTGTTLSMSADGFSDFDTCTDSYTKDTLEPGVIRIASSPIFSYDPHGNKVETTITLCSNKGLNGTCVTNKFTFTP